MRIKTEYRWLALLRLAVAPALSLSLISACAPARLARHASDPLPDPRAVVSATNRNWEDVRLYAVRDGIRWRLGTLSSGESRTFTMPTAFVGGSADVRLMAATVASRESYTSEPFIASPARRVEWLVEHRLNLSTISVR